MLPKFSSRRALLQVPIVEPEILLDGEHDIDRTLEVRASECLLPPAHPVLLPVF